jgi:hypothetical protein
MSDTRKVTDAEAAFLLLVARRVLNYQRKAEAEGEQYHDLQPLTDLPCGFAAKLRFETGPGGQYRPFLLLGPASVHPIVDTSLPVATQVAKEILGGPPHYVGSDDRGIKRFILERDR